MIDPVGYCRIKVQERIELFGKGIHLIGNDTTNRVALCLQNGRIALSPGEISTYIQPQRATVILKKNSLPYRALSA